MPRTTDAACILQDCLFTIAKHDLTTIAALRATCLQFKETIDQADANSEEWRQLACAALGLSSTTPLAPPLTVSKESTWMHVARTLALGNPSTSGLASSGHGGGLGQLSIQPDAVWRLLEWFSAAAEVAACDAQVSFAHVLAGDGRSHASLAIYVACSQKPPYNMQSQVYSWWLHAAFDVVRAIRGRMAAADPAAQAAARASFGAFVKQMASVCLPYLDRFFVRRFEVPGYASASLPTVREIGRRAVALLELPFDAPLPLEDPCPEVPRASSEVQLPAPRLLCEAYGAVDEEELVLRQRRAWQQRDLALFDQILLQSTGGGVAPPQGYMEN